MTDSEITLIRYRMARSKEALSAAELMYEKGHYNGRLQFKTGSEGAPTDSRDGSGPRGAYRCCLGIFPPPHTSRRF